MEEEDVKKHLRELFDSVLGSPEPPPMAELVARLDVWLARHRPSYHTRLLPGLSNREWAVFAGHLGVTLSDSIRILYQWRNGQSNEHSESFYGNRNWMSSEQIASTKELMDGMIGFDFEAGWWERAWVPFLHNGAGSYLCVDTVGTDGGKPGQLVEFWNRDADRPVVSRSLEHWLNHLVTSLECGPSPHTS